MLVYSSLGGNFEFQMFLFWYCFLFGDDTSVLISGLGGDGVFPGLGLLLTGAADILGEQCRGMLIGCLVVNESDFILDLLGSLLGRL